MPIFFQQKIDDDTRLGIWKIEEPAEFFLHNVPVHRAVTHPHKMLQHLAGRFLLQFLFPGFPYDQVQVADTRKPFVVNEAYHFSISHCGDYAAAIVSRNRRVGIDIEIPVEKIQRIRQKFLSEEEEIALKEWNEKGLQSSSFSDDVAEVRDSNQGNAPVNNIISASGEIWPLTVLWSAKEAMYKWYGDGGVDFKKDMLLRRIDSDASAIDARFIKNNTDLEVQYRFFETLVLAWTIH